VLQSFVAGIDWGQAGGESFVQLWTGLNLAFVAWKNYREELSWPLIKCEQIIAASTLNILDKPEPQVRVVVFFAKFSRIPLAVLPWFATICRAAAGLAFLIGIFVLYAHWCAAWDWMLMLPTLAYVSLSALALGVTAFGGWCLGVLPPGGSQVAEQIEKVDQATKN
jgi:hypothetical protein